MGYRFLILAGIIAVNAFFAAAEVSLISARKSKLRRLAEQGVTGAQAAQSLLASPARLLSVTQIGVTLASLALGWIGEGTVHALISWLLSPVARYAREPVMHAVSFGIAFLLMSYAHVVIGEVVPKNLAIEKADRLAILVAPLLLVFYRAASPFVFVIERSAAAISHLLGLHKGLGGGGHSAEEVKFIVSLSRTEGHLLPFEDDAIQSMLELKNYNAREIMVPRNAIVSLPADASLDVALDAMATRKYTRLPVYDGSPEHIVGYVHAKDLLRVWRERRGANEKRRQVRPFRLLSILRKAMVVPETKPLPDLIQEFREKHAHLAMVVDEFGTIVGLVTLEDVIEQVLGEIADEYDVKGALPPVASPLFEVEGSTLIRDLDNQYGVELPGDAGFETLAGFLLFRLGYIPKSGEAVEYGGRKFTILEMERTRIARVRIENDRVAAQSNGGT